MLAHTTAVARVGSGLDATAALPFAAPAGAVVTATQGAWSTSSRLGTAAFTADGFSVSIPSSAGGCAGDHSCVTGAYAWTLALHDPAAAEGGADPLGPCAALGPDVSGASGCGAFGGGTQRTSVTAKGELPVVDDTVTVTLTEPSLGTSSLRIAADGVRGSLDDGSLHVRGLPRRALGGDDRATTRRGAPVIQATAEALPFADDSFDAAMAIISDHHWTDRAAGMRELRRVARDRVVLVNVDPAANADFWLLRDYLPGFFDLVPEPYRRPGPWGEELRALLGGEVEVEPVPVPHDCRDGFMFAYWRRPEAYLDPAVRDGISVFRLLPEEEVRTAIERLRRDLDDGTWARRNAGLLEREELDVGLRLVVARL